jgi:hypothetical protein
MVDLFSVLPYLLAFIIAAIVAHLELIFTLYPNTHFLIRNRMLKAYYLAFYGIIGVAFYWLLIFTGVSVTLQNKSVDNPYIQAVIVGFISKGISDLSLFKMPFGDNAQPIGIKTITEPIQKSILIKIDQEESNSLREYVTAPNVCCNDSTDALRKIGANLPTKATAADRAAYKKDVGDLMKLFDEEVDAGIDPERAAERAAEIDQAKKDVALEKYLKDFGKRSFDRVFISQR